MMKVNGADKNLLRTLKSAPPILRYFLISCLATVMDVVLVWLLYKRMGYPVVPSNTIGVVTGFLISYLLSARFVFPAASGMRGFGVFFFTFIGGLVLADALIYWGETDLFTAIPSPLSFLASKGLSIAVPFFVMYFVRRALYGYLERRDRHGKH
jgi:putative flippase GtrA